MPWFPDFVAAAELARRETRAAGMADPISEYLAALTTGSTRELETVWPGHVVVLDPYAGEVRGHHDLRRFVRNSESFLADRLVDAPRVASTAAGGRSAVELLAHLTLNGEPVTWPVAVVAESHDERSVTFRTYGSQWPVVGRRPVRPPIVDPDPAAAPGDVVARYLTALAAGDQDGIVQTFDDDGSLQEPIGPHALHRGTRELAEWFSRYLRGGGVEIERCCVTDDGVRCALEYNLVRWGGEPLPAAGRARGVRTRRQRRAPRRPVLRRHRGTHCPLIVLENAPGELTSHRRLRVALGPAQRRARQPGRVDRLAVLPALRQPLDLRSAARRRSGALVGARRGCPLRHPSLHRPHDGPGDHVRLGDRDRGGDRRAGRRRGKPRAFPRARLAPPPPPAGHLHRG